jgi:hypothetical protein
VLSADRQLPHLQSLHIGDVTMPVSSGHMRLRCATAPEGSLLVNCCTGLQSLDLQKLRYSAKLLAPLAGLSVLTALRLAVDNTVYYSPTVCCCWRCMGLGVACKLTGLRELVLRMPAGEAEGLVLQLTQLKQLTRLTYPRDTAAFDDRCSILSTRAGCSAKLSHIACTQFLSAASLLHNSVHTSSHFQAHHVLVGEESLGSRMSQLNSLSRFIPLHTLTLHPWQRSRQGVQAAIAEHLIGSRPSEGQIIPRAVSTAHNAELHKARYSIGCSKVIGRLITSIQNNPCILDV